MNVQVLYGSRKILRDVAAARHVHGEWLRGHARVQCAFWRSRVLAWLLPAVALSCWHKFVQQDFRAVVASKLTTR